MPALRWKRLGVLILASLLLSACALRSPVPATETALLSTAPGARLQGTLMELATRRVLPFDAFVAAIASAQVIALGEEHYHADIQAFELRLLQALASRRPQQLALAMEFLERDMQPAVDAYLAGSSAAATLHEQIKATPEFLQYYFPCMQYAKQAGVPILAMNAPRSLARRVTREGLEAVVTSLQPPARAYLATTFAPITASYRTYFLRAVATAHPLPAEQVERFVEAAYLKDETMAESLAAWLDRTADGTVLAIAGRFHFDYGMAIPALLQRRRPDVTIQRVTAMAVTATESIDLQQLARESLADYVWFAPARPETRASRSGQDQWRS